MTFRFFTVMLPQKFDTSQKTNDPRNHRNIIREAYNKDHWKINKKKREFNLNEKKNGSAFDYNEKRKTRLFCL